MKKYTFHYVDAFTDTPFFGNPCAVFPEAEGLNTADMQKIARETNLNETAFVFPADRANEALFSFPNGENGGAATSEEKADFVVRYFAPTSEIPFAGHPTIATAFLLARLGAIPPTADAAPDKTVTVRFKFNIGVLPVEIEFREGAPVMVGMEQKPPQFGQVFDTIEIAPMLGLSVENILDDYPAQVVSTGVPFLMVPVANCKDVIRAEMDRQTLRQYLEHAQADAVFLFSAEGYTPEGNTYARLLNPAGTSEDPFTGSASGCMGCYLYNRGIIKKPAIKLEQGHHLGRPGSGKLILTGDPNHITRVQLYGTAATTLTGSLLL
jgi:trans-2,3-dihydro-3-hydroxyanthranilate isomerase